MHEMASRDIDALPVLLFFWRGEGLFVYFLFVCKESQQGLKWVVDHGCV